MLLEPRWKMSRSHRRSPPSSSDKYSLRELKEIARREEQKSSRRRSDHHDHDHDRGQDKSHHWRPYSDRKPYRNRSPDRSEYRGDRRNNRYDRRRQNDPGNRIHPEMAKTEPSEASEPSPPPPPEIKPNFGLTGALARDTNTFNGIVVKYNQPPEAKKPSKHWRLYPFKGTEALEHISIHTQSAYLLGRERKVADIPIDHPSCSKQHAVIQFRCITMEKPDGSTAKTIRPYIIDLDSANGTYVNHKKIEPRRYVELLEKDVIKFGFSSREYVLLHEHSAKDSPDDDDGDGDDGNSKI